MPTELRDWLNNTVDDSVIIPAFSQDAVKLFSGLFPEGGWEVDGVETEGCHPRGYECSWSGIVGMVRHLCLAW